MKQLLPLCSLLLIPVFSAAQDHPAPTAPANSVYVGADGKFEAAPDTAVIQFNISQQEATSQAAYQHTSKDTEKVREMLRANGIDPKTASFGTLAVQPVLDWKNAKQKVLAYRVTADVSLQLKDFSKVGPITQQLADANVGGQQNLEYSLENIDDAKNKAVEDAYRHARNSAETIARSSGRTLESFLTRQWTPRSRSASCRAWRSR